MSNISTKAKAAKFNNEDKDAKIKAILLKIEEQFMEGEWKLPFFAAKPHRNLSSNAHYKGMNTFMLNIACIIEPEYSRGWLTFIQARTLGLKMVGAKGKGIQLVNWFPKATKETEHLPLDHPQRKTYLLPSYFHVFNSTLFLNSDGTPYLETPNDVLLSLGEQKDLLLSFAELTGCKVIHTREQGAAYYSPSKHTVNIPHPSEFFSEEAYIAVLAHELCHSTQAVLRSDWKKGKFGTPEYAIEELAAELGSIFVSSMLGIEKLEIANHAQYIKSWCLRAKEVDENYFEKAIKAAIAIQDYVYRVLYPEPVVTTEVETQELENA